MYRLATNGENADQNQKQTPFRNYKYVSSQATTAILDNDLYSTIAIPCVEGSTTARSAITATAELLATFEMKSYEVAFLKSVAIIVLLSAVTR